MTDGPIIFSAPMVRALTAGTKTQTRRILKPQPFIDTMGNFCVPGKGGKHWNYGQHIDGRPCVRNFAAEGVRYKIGDRLWVRETCRAEELSRPPTERAATRKERQLYSRTKIIDLDELDGTDGVRYLADDHWRKIDNTPEAGEAWGEMFYYRGRGTGILGNTVPPIHMPRWASRLTLTATDVRVQRLQDISEDDAMAEGVTEYPSGWWSAQEGDAAPTPKVAYALLWNHINGPGAWDANPWVVAVTFTVADRNIDEVGNA